MPRAGVVKKDVPASVFEEIRKHNPISKLEYDIGNYLKSLVSKEFTSHLIHETKRVVEPMVRKCITSLGYKLFHVSVEIGPQYRQGTREVVARATYSNRGPLVQKILEIRISI